MCNLRFSHRPLRTGQASRTRPPMSCCRILRLRFSFLRAWTSKFCNDTSAEFGACLRHFTPSPLRSIAAPPVNRSTGWRFHFAPLRRPESSETGFAPRPESGGFCSGFAPPFLSLRSAKPPHSGHPGFELVTQPESLSVPLTRPFAPATMLGLAALALCVWASSNGRPLHSGPFRLRDKGSRPPRSRFLYPLSPPA